GDVARIGQQPVTYLHASYPRAEMAALYRAADVMVVTPLRDGMNLVAKEYVASRFDNDGVLVLSEFAGAADELKQALLVNPHDIEGLKEAIMKAIAMPQSERSRRMRALRKRVIEFDVARWSKSFLDELAGLTHAQSASEAAEVADAADTTEVADTAGTADAADVAEAGESPQ
ncbi:MAG: trehalose 6-phosphate synthase, partial [Subtercola sp.]|nr:trehalose 6-phosphate synthase [Subtercola sp.]